MGLRIVGPISLIMVAVWSQAATSAQPNFVHRITPGQEPQSVLDRSSPGDRIVFLPGVHQHPLNRHRSILYVDKSIDIELMAGAVLKLADNQTTLLTDPEITIDHGAPKKLHDLSVGGTYDLGLGRTFFNIRIDGEGGDGKPDTFRWSAAGHPKLSQSNVPITGQLQTLRNGVQIKFESTTGHNRGNYWVISYDGRESYGIRVGHGVQEDYIENVRIYGKGTIDLNQTNNVQPTEWVKDISACVLIHGRVRNVLVEDITIRNVMRSVMVYGTHTGKFLQGGGTEGGRSFDAENISIFYTKTINPDGKAFLLGHPSHRGRLSKVRCNFNYMETQATALEPNFNLDQYEVIGNVIKSDGLAIHCWRKSTNGLIKDNVRIDDDQRRDLVIVNSPAAWEDPENLIIRDNRNHLSDPIGYFANVSGGKANQALGHYATIGGGRGNATDAAYATVSGGRENQASGNAATVSGGVKNKASGNHAAVTGGSDNEAAAVASRVHGVAAKSSRVTEDVLASGSFTEPGDAQSSHLVVKCLTADGQYAALGLAGGAQVTVRENTSVAFRALVVVRGNNGKTQAAFRAEGLAHREFGEGLTLLQNDVNTIHKTDPALELRVLPGPDGASLRLEAKGLERTELRWVGRVELVEVVF